MFGSEAVIETHVAPGPVRSPTNQPKGVPEGRKRPRASHQNLINRQRTAGYGSSSGQKCVAASLFRGFTKEILLVVANYYVWVIQDKILDALVDKTPREQRQLLERALARAVRLGEAIVCLDHLEQVTPKAKLRPRRAIGYL